MLRSEFRLKKSRDISRVFKRGSFGAAKELSVKAASNNLPNSRVVVVVSKKVSKKAVVRNKIRRRVSGVLEADWKTVETGYDIVVTVREDVSDMSAAGLKAATLTALRRADVISGKS